MRLTKIVSRRGLVITCFVSLVLNGSAILAAPSPAIQQPPQQSANPGQVHAREAENKLQRLKLRVFWGGGAPTAWTGSMQIVGGKFIHLSPLGMLPDCSANILLDESITIRQTLATSYNGCDLDVDVSPGSELVVDLSSPRDSVPAWSTRVPVSQLLANGRTQYDIDSRKNQLVIERAPGDVLSLDFHRDNLVFDAGQQVALTINPRRPQMTAGAEGEIRLSIRNQKTREVSWKTAITVKCQPSGEIATVPSQTLTLPSDEGIYDLQVELTEFTRRGPFPSERSIADRHAQFVVLEPRPVNVDASEQLWQERFVLDPTRPERWTMRRQINQLKLPVRYPKTLGSNTSVTRVGDRDMLRLGPKGWQAFALPIDDPNQPHLLEIEYWSGKAMALGLSVLEPDASGQIPFTGVDAGVFVPHSLVHSRRGCGFEELGCLASPDRLLAKHASAVPIDRQSRRYE